MGGSGFYGSDCLCGHCEAVMFRDFNPDLLSVRPETSPVI
jgi:hypothetical protein